jgi:GT2 family glycosyltransferase
MMPAVWVIVVNWNQRQLTLECLASLRAAADPACRVLLVDNGSTDGSAEAVRREFPEVEVLETGVNLLYAGGNNAGIARALAAGAQLIVLLNNDTVVDPGCTRHLRSRMEADPRCGIVGPKIYYAESRDRIWYAGGEMSFWKGELWHRGIRQTDRGQYDTSETTGYVTGCCLMIRREALERAGMLDESFRMYGEDADLCMRVRRAGFDILYEPAAHVWHKISMSSGGHLTWSKQRRKAVSMIRFFIRHAAWYQLPVMLFLAPLANAAAAIRYLLTARQ